MGWVDPLGLERQGISFPESDLYQGQEAHTVTIEMTGSRGDDFKAANEKAGFVGKRGRATQGAHPKNYTWHHKKDYDPCKNTCTMQLVKMDKHKAIGHSGSVSQYEKHHGVEYK